MSDQPEPDQTEPVTPRYLVIAMDGPDYRTDYLVVSHERQWWGHVVATCRTDSDAMEVRDALEAVPPKPVEPYDPDSPPF